MVHAVQVSRIVSGRFMMSVRPGLSPFQKSGCLLRREPPGQGQPTAEGPAGDQLGVNVAGLRCGDGITRAGHEGESMHAVAHGSGTFMAGRHTGDAPAKPRSRATAGATRRIRQHGAAPASEIKRSTTGASARDATRCAASQINGRSTPGSFPVSSIDPFAIRPAMPASLVSSWATTGCGQEGITLQFEYRPGDRGPGAACAGRARSPDRARVNFDPVSMLALRYGRSGSGGRDAGWISAAARLIL